MKVHNGQKGNAEWLFNGNEFLSIQDILMAWSVWIDLLNDGDFDNRISKPDRQINSGWWIKEWVPFASNAGGDYLCLDLNPSASGHIGQVIKIYHDFPKRVLISTSFAEWFKVFLKNKII
jgi:cell wall assembly regulator SMI1